MRSILARQCHGIDRLAHHEACIEHKIASLPPRLAPIRRRAEEDERASWQARQCFWPGVLLTQRVVEAKENARVVVEYRRWPALRIGKGLQRSRWLLKERRRRLWRRVVQIAHQSRAGPLRPEAKLPCRRLGRWHAALVEGGDATQLLKVVAAIALRRRPEWHLESAAWRVDELRPEGVRFDARMAKDHGRGVSLAF